MMIYPWQKEQWDYLKKMQQRLPHALLLSGIAGLGKRQFADMFAASLFCINVQKELLCNCHSCELIKIRAHPNVRWLFAEKSEHVIKIDQIRTIHEFLMKTGLDAKERIVIIHSAHQMNSNAANALLKILEEPPAHAMLVLLTHQFQQLPATILSRCQRIHFPLPKKQMAIEWLKMKEFNQNEAELLLAQTHGAPLAALSARTHSDLALRKTLLDYFSIMSEKEALQFAEKIKEGNILAIIDFSLSFAQDILKCQFKAEQNHIVNFDYLNDLFSLKEKLITKKIIKFCEKMCQLRCFLQKGINLNKLLVIENILLGWLECRYATG